MQQRILTPFYFYCLKIKTILCFVIYLMVKLSFFLENENGKTYYIQLENQKIGPQNDFEIVFLLAFALYFNFGLCYPKECSCTFEFIQRYVFKIHQESGTKSLSKNVKTKVFTLITKLASL